VAIVQHNSRITADPAPKVPMLAGGAGLVMLVVASVVVAACGGEDIGLPTTGSVAITTTTAGDAPDTDGYRLLIDESQATTIGVVDTLERNDLEPGEHTIHLVGVADTCTVEGDNPRTVSVVAGETVRVDFLITCAAGAGAVRVRVSTSGSPVDPDGYVVKLDGGDPGQPVPATGEVTFAGVPAGDHTVELSGLEQGCSVDGNPTQPVAVAGGGVAEVAFAVTCSETTGQIEVVTVTTGSASDADGYAVRVDEREGQPIGANDRQMVVGLGLGTHLLTLTGLAGNCHVAGDNPRLISMGPGATSVTFEVTCLGADALIAFTSNAADLLGIFVVRPDGSGLQNLTPAGEFETNPRWSPDGRQLLVLRDGDVYVMDANGGPRTLLADGFQITDYRWSPDGRRIAYVDLRPEGDDVIEDLWVMMADGSDQHPVAHGGFSFAWSPDGRLVYTSVADLADVHLRIVNVDGSNDVRLTQRAAFQPAWSPDGGRIAYVSLGDKDIFTIDPDGSDETNLTHGRGEDEAPVWSPNGSTLLFTAGSTNDFNESEIAVMGRDGSGRTLLTHHPGFDFEPVWSPDGSKIVFTRSDETGDSEIFVMDAAGGNEIDVSRRPESFETGPDWNGDGSVVTLAGRQSPSFYERWSRANHRVLVPLGARRSAQR